MKVLVGFMGLVLAVLSTFCIYWTWTNPVQVQYEGKIVFHDNQSYVGFKQVVAETAVEITDIIVLSSSPPIVVQYNINAPSDFNFPYGNHPDAARAKLPKVGFMLISGAVGIFLLLVHRTKWFYK